MCFIERFFFLTDSNFFVQIEHTFNKILVILRMRSQIFKRNQTVFCEFYFKQEQITFSATLNQPQLVWTLICPISDNVSPRRRLFRHTCPTPEVVHWPELLAKDVWGLLEPRCWTFQSSSTGPASGRGRSDRPDSIRPRRFLAWSVFSRDPTFFSFDVDDQA